MPRPTRIKLRNTNELLVSMDNAFTQDSKVTEEKVFDETENEITITSITITGPLVGYPSPLVITLSSNDDCTISVDYQINSSDQGKG
jgi:hypothetical protein